MKPIPDFYFYATSIVETKNRLEEIRVLHIRHHVDSGIRIQRFHGAAQVGDFLHRHSIGEPAPLYDLGVVFPLGNVVHHQAFDPGLGGGQMHPGPEGRTGARQEIRYRGEPFDPALFPRDPAPGVKRRGGSGQRLDLDDLPWAKTKGLSLRTKRSMWPCSVYSSLMTSPNSC